MLLSLLSIASTTNKLNRIAALSLTTNLTFQSKNSVSLKYSNHPLFLSNQKNLLSSLTLINSKFVKSFSAITQGYFRNLLVKNCVFSDSKQPINVAGENSMYTRTVKNRTEFSKYLMNIYYTRFLRCGLESKKNEYGGAIFAQSVQLVFAKCLFDSCMADYGGAIFLNSSTKAELKFVHFSGCTGLKKGGAVYFKEATVLMDMCVIAGCRADEGGALFCKGFSMLRLTNGSIFNNIAHRGAAVILQSSSTMMFRVFFTGNNCTKEKNDAVELYDSDAFLEEVMFARNINIETGKPGDLKYEGDGVINMTSCCIPGNSPLSPILKEIAKNSSNLMHIGECPELDNEIPEAEETIDYFYSVKNSTSTAGFFLSVIGAILIPIIIMLLLPFLFNGNVRQPGKA
jgi:hypothetical protein